MTDKTMEDSPKKKSVRSKLRKIIKRRLPITGWITSYTKKDLVSDIIAGLCVGLTVVPQSMAYTNIVGLSPEYGLYSSYIGVLTYILLGSCRQATIGPTAVMELLAAQTCGQNYSSCVILTGFYAGIIQLILAVLRLSWVVSFISEPVTIGFTAGAAMTILSSQIKSFLGIRGSKGSGFLGYWYRIILDFRTLHGPDALLGLCSFITLTVLSRLKDTKHPNKYIKTGLWLTSLSRNVMVIVVTSGIAWGWGTPPFKLIGTVHRGFPPVALPQFSLPVKDLDTYPHSHNNGTTNYLTFWESCSLISTGPLVIAVISILQNVAISKAFGSGGKVDATQEMIALGMSSMFGGFFSSMPISASFSRSAVNEASGVRTQMGGLFAGILVILSLEFLTPSFYFIPKASSSAVIISAVMGMIEYEAILPMWRISKLDGFASLTTFLCSLFLGMGYGITVGVAISVGGILFSSLKPEVIHEIRKDDSSGIQYLLITPSKTGVHFPSIDHVSSTIQKLSLRNKLCRIIVLNFSQWCNYDYTGANSLLSLVKGMKKNGKLVVLLNCSKEWVKVFEVVEGGGSKLLTICEREEELATFLLRKVCLHEQMESSLVTKES